MKKCILFSAVLAALATSVPAQDTTQATAYLRHLRAQDSARRKMIECYLMVHPTAKASFRDSKGRLNYIHHIDKNGKPVYYRERSTKK